MNIIIAPDKFKGSLSALQVCESIEKGLHRANANWQITSLPLSDGGDGLADILSNYFQGQIQTTPVHNPVGEIIPAEWMVSKDGTTAIIEMAKASGISLIQPDQYNPSGTSTYGTGQLIRAALEKSVSKIILGIGGSATNDGGIGLAAALGYRFLDGNNQELPPNGGSLASIQTIDTSAAMSTNHIEFLIACDVKNPLTGPMGATHVYAKQKGADPAMIEQLEQGMVHYAAIIKKQFGIDISLVEGGGAAGGLGAGCLVFLNAKLVSGIGLVMQISGLEKHVKHADLVITGEGKVDEQSLMGKVVAGVCSLTKKYSKRTIIVCGTNQLEAFQLEALNNVEIYPIAPVGRSLQYSIDNAAKLLVETGFSIGQNLEGNTVENQAV